ncbi:MAG TPA: DUF2911 domain-containing protein [Candidatus Acidoferrales bacterium]|nr:DUF2911 domain-containing protein [Candidatus Acidoferrales bacterium]
MRRGSAAACRVMLLGVIVAAMLGGAQLCCGQIASPPAKAECRFSDGKAIHVDYSSPRMRGRKIIGDLVPFGEPWRVGANEATTFVLDVDADVAGKLVPAGSYTLFALPTKTAWTLIISKQTGEWGIPYPGEQYDLVRVPMKVSKLASPLENFTIAFDHDGRVCRMRLDWETTRASVPIEEKK